MGDRITEYPVATNCPPQEEEYHFHTAPVPRLPPDIVSVAESPKLIEATIGIKFAGMELV